MKPQSNLRRGDSYVRTRFCSQDGFDQVVLRRLAVAYVLFTQGEVSLAPRNTLTIGGLGARSSYR
jgi:hypothetical protein